MMGALTDNCGWVKKLSVLASFPVAVMKYLMEVTVLERYSPSVWKDMETGMEGGWRRLVSHRACTLKKQRERTGSGTGL